MPKKRSPEALETIDLGALQTVSGGRTSATAAAAAAGGGTGSSPRNSATTPPAAAGAASDPMMQLLTQIENSLQAMSQNQTQDPFMRAMMMMQMAGGNGGYRPR